MSLTRTVTVYPSPEFGVASDEMPLPRLVAFLQQVCKAAPVDPASGQCTAVALGLSALRIQAVETLTPAQVMAMRLDHVVAVLRNAAGNRDEAGLDHAAVKALLADLERTAS